MEENRTKDGNPSLNDSHQQFDEYQHFVLRYRQSCKERDIKPYDIPSEVMSQITIDDSDILPLLLNDDQFFHAAYCHVHSDEKLKVHLWDALGTDPEQLDKVIRALTIFLGNDGLGDKWDINCEHIEDVPNKLEKMGVENSDERMAYEFAALCLRRRIQEHKLTGTSTLFPFLSGMRAYLQHLHQVTPAFIGGVLLHTSRMLPSIPESHIATSSEGLQHALIDGASSDRLGIFYIYYNVAGAGKTAQIFKLLSQNWGIYAISPNVPVEYSTTASHTNEHDVVGAHRSFCSRDTFTLYSDVQSVTRIVRKHWRKVFAAGLLNQTFVRARCVLLEVYRSLRDSSPGQPSPLRWLQLQVSCVTRAQDPFDMTYRLLRLHAMIGNNISLYFGSGISLYLGEDISLCLGPDSASGGFSSAQEESQSQQQSHFGERYFCLDEMQTALDNETSRDILGTICHTLLGISEETRNYTDWIYPITYRRVVLSGTSLNVQNLVHFFEKMLNLETLAKKASGNTRKEASLPEPRVHLSLSTTTQMPYIFESDQFWSFYKAYISSIVTELVAHGSIDCKAHVSQIPLLARSGRALPFRIPIEEFITMRENWQTPKETFEPSSRQSNWWFRPLSAASKLQTLNFVTGWILTHCHNQESIDEVGKKLQHEVKFTQENDSLQDFDYLDSPTNQIDENIRRFVKQGSDVNVLLPFLRVMPRLCQKSQTDFLHSLATGLRNSNAVPASELGKGVQRLQDRCMWYLVDHYAKPFRGRYRWSAFFVEELMNGNHRHEHNVSSVRKVCHSAHETVRSRVCDILQERLSQLAESPQYKDLVSHLLKMAWRAYLLRVPSICKNERAMDLVEKGFARTRQTTQGAVLDEPLAIQAVMQFLRQNPRYYEDEIHDEMGPSQFDREKRTLTGKMHELSIAMTFDQLLRPSGEQYTMETEDDYKSRKERSQYLFDVLSKAVAYKYSTSGSVRLGLEGYELREGGGVMDYTTTENIWSWLRDENRSTFLFPDNNAHPDLMFILERRRKSSNDTDGPRTGRIICALQSKLGEIDNYKKQVAHIRPDEWYTTEGQLELEKEKVRAEFRQFANDFANDKFLLILASAGGEPNRSLFDKRVKQEGTQKSGNFYFCYMSSDDVKRIFLQRYERFLKQLREKTYKSW